MSKVTYSAEPQHQVDGVWQLCLPHAATRWVVIRRTWLPQRRGQMRPAPRERILATFTGAGAADRARELTANAISKGKCKPKAARS